MSFFRVRSCSFRAFGSVCVDIIPERVQLRKALARDAAKAKSAASAGGDDEEKETENDSSKQVMSPASKKQRTLRDMFAAKGSAETTKDEESAPADNSDGEEDAEEQAEDEAEEEAQEEEEEGEEEAEDNEE